MGIKHKKKLGCNMKNSEPHSFVVFVLCLFIAMFGVGGTVTFNKYQQLNKQLQEKLVKENAQLKGRQQENRNMRVQLAELTSVKQIERLVAKFNATSERKLRSSEEWQLRVIYPENGLESKHESIMADTSYGYVNRL